jgi:glyoxalase family protein
MHMELGGLHHVSAVTGNAPGNVAFYTQALGLRLVKKTVNQDDVSMYHLFYGDELGSPGTEVTFFDWGQAGPNRSGAGEIAEIALRVPSRASLDWWQQRFAEYGVAHQPVVERAGRAALAFSDPEWQRLALVDDGGAPGGTPWAGSPVPAEHAIRGMHAVTLVVARREPSAALLTGLLGFRAAGEYTLPGQDERRVSIFATAGGGPGTEVHLLEDPDAPRARVGVGGVHHVAFRTPDDEQHRQWQARIAAAGLHVTPQIDRYYFRSLYFREPGGILYEIATDGPGFATDEDAAHLGERLALPPFLEPHRREIEAGLQPLPTAGAAVAG